MDSQDVPSSLQLVLLVNVTKRRRAYCLYARNFKYVNGLVGGCVQLFCMRRFFTALLTPETSTLSVVTTLYTYFVVIMFTLTCKYLHKLVHDSIMCLSDYRRGLDL